MNDAPPSINWLAVTTGLANGDAASLEVYYTEWFEPMLREARRLIGPDENSCLDVVQDSMLKVLRSIRPMDSPQRVGAWSRSVVRSVAYDWLRRRSRQTANAWSLELSDPRESAESHWLEAEARRIWVEEQIQQRPDEVRQMFSLRFRLGWTLQRIAAHFGMKPGAVDGRIRRELDALRAKAQPELRD
jgi:RNA polymerase sigma factor (sigma-70 family)